MQLRQLLVATVNRFVFLLLQVLEQIGTIKYFRVSNRFNAMIGDSFFLYSMPYIVSFAVAAAYGFRTPRATGCNMHSNLRNHSIYSLHSHTSPIVFDEIDIGNSFAHASCTLPSFIFLSAPSL